MPARGSRREPLASNISWVKDLYPACFAGHWRSGGVISPLEPSRCNFVAAFRVATRRCLGKTRGDQARQR